MRKGSGEYQTRYLLVIEQSIHIILTPKIQRNYFLWLRESGVLEYLSLCDLATYYVHICYKQH